MQVHDHIYTFDTLTSYPNLVHGISTRFFGSMRYTDPQVKEHLAVFAQALGINVDEIILMNQTHSSTVTWVGSEQKGKRIPDTDAIITAEKGVYLAIHTADCTPVFLYDTSKNVVAAIHAGWRGLYGEIIGETVQKMIEKGSKVDDIKAAIGPCICGKCYEFGQDIVDTFIEKFKDKHGNPLPYIHHEHGKVSVDQVGFARLQLVQAGVSDDSIEVSGICTKEQAETFFSYRGEGPEKFGGFLSVIGMKGD